MSPFLWTVTTWTFFQSELNFPSFRKSLKIIESGLHIEFPHNFIIRILSISWPWALFWSKLFIILEMSSVEKLTASSDLLVSFARLLGKTLYVLACPSLHVIKAFSFLLYKYFISPAIILFSLTLKLSLMRYH